MPTLENFSLFEIPGILVNVLVVGYMLYAVWRRGGVKNATFNARIKSTAGEAQGHFGGAGNIAFKVHLLERDGESLIGLECASSTFSSFELLSATLTKEQARKLGAVLLQAAA